MVYTHSHIFEWHCKIFCRLYENTTKLFNYLCRCNIFPIFTTWPNDNLGSSVVFLKRVVRERAWIGNTNPPIQNSHCRTAGYFCSSRLPNFVFPVERHKRKKTFFYPIISTALAEITSWYLLRTIWRSRSRNNGLKFKLSSILCLLFCVLYRVTLLMVLQLALLTHKTYIYCFNCIQREQ